MIVNIVDFVMSNVFLPLIVILLLIITIYSVVFISLLGFKGIKEFIVDFKNQK